jgi:hypothetical protein
VLDVGDGERVGAHELAAVQVRPLTASANLASGRYASVLLICSAN